MNQLNIQKQKIRNYKLAELLRSDGATTIEIDKSLNKNFILVLLRNGYIGEDYIDYISLFHEESITRADYQFHISIKNSIKQPFEYKLFKIEKLVSKINPFDFQSEYILNYDLLNYLLFSSQKYPSQLDFIFDKLKDESKISIEFIQDYCKVSESLPLFAKILCNKWNSIQNLFHIAV